jgi:hypothetical protein
MTGIEQEEWFGLVAHQGYEVSTHERVRSYWKRGATPKLCETPRLVSVWPNRKGYLQTNVRLNGRIQTVSIHCLLLQVFVGPWPEGMVGRHLNDIPWDNRPENLAWGTRKENAQDASRNGRLRLCGRKKQIA